MTDATQVRAQDALIPATINAVINGAIAYSGFKAEAAIPMTLDLISSKQHTVWGQGVTLAFALAQGVWIALAAWGLGLTAAGPLPAYNAWLFWAGILACAAMFAFQAYRIATGQFVPTVTDPEPEVDD